MAKIMLVEDDNNLREIYEARLLAEGYEIVSAKDGEEALALAVKEKPDLIIADVMMPKISGFDMLDILRSTPETKGTKIVMMTALSQAEDKSRAEKLGADRYLVKSQVTLEDVAKTAREILGGETPAAPASPTPPAAADSADNATPAPTASAPEPTPAPAPSTPAPEPPAAPEPAPEPAPAPEPTPAPSTPPEPSEPPAAPAGSSADEPDVVDQTQTTAAEEAVIDKQINDFVSKTYGADAAAPAASPESSESKETPPSAAPARKIAVAEAPDEAASQATATSPEDRPAGEIKTVFSPSEEPSAAADQPAAQATNAPASESIVGDGQVAHKKVISPLNDLSKEPDMSELLKKEAQKEEEQFGVEDRDLPTSSVVKPGGETIAPTAPSSGGGEANTQPDQPGNVIKPSGAPDPNTIAL